MSALYVSPCVSDRGRGVLRASVSGIMAPPSPPKELLEPGPLGKCSSQGCGDFVMKTEPFANTMWLLRQSVNAIYNAL